MNRCLPLMLTGSLCALRSQHLGTGARRAIRLHVAISRQEIAVCPTANDRAGATVPDAVTFSPGVRAGVPQEQPALWKVRERPQPPEKRARLVNGSDRYQRAVDGRSRASREFRCRARNHRFATQGEWNQSQLTFSRRKKRKKWWNPEFDCSNSAAARKVVPGYGITVLWQVVDQRATRIPVRCSSLRPEKHSSISPLPGSVRNTRSGQPVDPVRQQPAD